MGQSISGKRPWLAALLAALATGLGHLYLRRWRRALGWLVILFGSAFLFVDPAVLDALGAWNSVDPLAIAPLLLVGCLNVVDAYVLARARNVDTRRTADADGRLTCCPHCGNELEPELDFCHWCTAEIADRDPLRPENRDERDAS